MARLRAADNVVTAVVCDPSVVLNSRSRPESDAQRSTVEDFLRSVSAPLIEVVRLSDLCRDARLIEPDSFALVEAALTSSFHIFNEIISGLSLSAQARADLEQYRSATPPRPVPLSLAGAVERLRRSGALDDRRLLALLYAFTSRPTWFDSQNLAATGAMLCRLTASGDGEIVTIMEADRNAYSWLALEALWLHAQTAGDLRDAYWPELRFVKNIPSLDGAPYMRLANPDGCLFIDMTDAEMTTALADASEAALDAMSALSGDTGHANKTSDILDLIRRYRRDAGAARLLTAVKPSAPDGADAVSLILRGGGARVIATVGAVEVLWSHYNFQSFWGTSAGAIVAVLLGAGYRPDEILTVLESQPMSSLFSGSRLRRYWNLVMHGSMYTEDTIGEWLQALLRAKVDTVGPVRMRDLPFPTTVLATQAGQGTVAFDSDGERSDVAASFAVRSSMAIPFAFRPTHHEGARLYDGGLLNNFPVREFEAAEDGRRPFLGIAVRSVAKHPRWWHRGRLSVLGDVTEIWLAQDEASIVTHYEENVVVINTDPIRTLDLHPTDREVDFLVSAGRSAALEFLLRRGRADPDACALATRATEALREAVAATRRRG